MWRLSIEDDEANRTVVNLVRKEYSIGRAEENSVRLTERNVSRLHAILRRTADGWVLEDLNSHTGSFVNERRVEGVQPIDHRDKIRIGDYDISLLDSEREAEEAAIDKQTETVPSAAEGDEQLDRHDRLVVVEGPNPGTQYPLLDKKILIGRGEECDIALQDTSVSRVHASLTRDEHGRFHISDQKSSNGVRVNGMEITKIPLYAGDVVELGDVHLQFVPKGSRFDEHALRSPVHATPAQSDTTGPSKLWLAAGALVMVGLVMWFAPERRRGAPEESAQATPIVSEEAIVEQAQALIQARDFDGAVALVRGLPANTPAKASAKYRGVVNSWADAQFQRVESVSDRTIQLQVLQSVVDFIDVDPRRRARAQAQIDTLNRPPEPEAVDSSTDATDSAEPTSTTPQTSMAPANQTPAPAASHVSVAAQNPVYVAPTTPVAAPAAVTPAPAPNTAPKPVTTAVPSTSAVPANPAAPPVVTAKPSPTTSPAPVVTPTTNTQPSASAAPVAPVAQPTATAGTTKPVQAPVASQTPVATQPAPTGVPTPSRAPAATQAPTPAPAPTQPAPQQPTTPNDKPPAAPAQPAPPVVNWPGATP